jgi:hypothetical protein
MRTLAQLLIPNYQLLIIPPVCLSPPPDRRLLFCLLKRSYYLFQAGRRGLRRGFVNALGAIMPFRIGGFGVLDIGFLVGRLFILVGDRVFGFHGDLFRK